MKNSGKKEGETKLEGQKGKDKFLRVTNLLQEALQTLYIIINYCLS